MGRTRSVRISAPDRRLAYLPPNAPLHRPATTGWLPARPRWNASPIAGQAEAQLPGDLLADVAAQRNTEEGTGVHAHVEQRVAAITGALVVLAVELADDRRDVRLEQAVAEDEDAEREMERARAVEGEQEVADGQEHGSSEDRTAVAENTVRQDAAEERRQVDEADVRAVQRRGVPLAHLELLV